MGVRGWMWLIVGFDNPSHVIFMAQFDRLLGFQYMVRIKFGQAVVNE